MNKNKGVRLGMFKINEKEILWKDLKSTKITARLLAKKFNFVVNMSWSS